MTPDELDAIEARAAAATPGPWAAEDERHGKGSCSCCGEVLYAWNIVAPSREVVVSAMDDVTPGVHGDADAAFIAHARTDVPALVAALREARAEVEAMRRGEVDGIFTSVVHECCERVETAETEVEALSRWKAEALAVLAEWDGVYEALGSPATLGERKSTASFREAKRLRDREAADDPLSMIKKAGLPTELAEAMIEAAVARAVLAERERIAHEWEASDLALMLQRERIALAIEAERDDRAHAVHDPQCADCEAIASLTRAAAIARGEAP